MKMKKDKNNSSLLITIGIVLIIILIGIFIGYLLVGKRTNTINDLELILKEKDKLYKSLTTPQPYCGKNSTQYSNIEIDPNGEYSKDNDIMYWSLSNEFQTYNQLQNYISENLTDNLIQELGLKNYHTFNKEFYLEKDNKLYCGHIGASSVSPKNTTYKISEYDDNKIVGISTDIYNKESVDIGLVKKEQYNNDIILVKENNVWKIEKYISEMSH